MKNFKGKKVLILVIAIIAVLGTTITAYAAVGAVSSMKYGNQYIVDQVTNEKYVDGILVQTIERQWIPENRYNPNDQTHPYPSVPTPGPTYDKTYTLRNAGYNSRFDLQNYASKYAWRTSVVETSASENRVDTNVTFDVDDTSSADRWIITFQQVVTFDKNGSPNIEYYSDGQRYTVSAIKKMFEMYGKK